MDVDIVEQVEDWESEPFSGGYAGLHDLSDRSFTGAVETGGTYLFMLNGRTVGVFDLPPVGSPRAPIEAFEDATGTVYEAPHPSLPLLFTMLVSDGETRGQYYTEDTPIEEVDGQLSEGGFTGYVELSENVLSGDYYVVYQAGRSMSAAFVGASSRLHTDEEAFELASDEVGIYDVVAVDIDVIDVPEPASGAASEPDTAPDAGSAVAAGSAATSDEDPDGAAAGSGAEPERATDADAAESSATESDADGTESPTDSGASDADASPEHADDPAGVEDRDRDRDLERDRAAGRPDDELTDATERVDRSELEPDRDADSATRETTGAAASPTHDTNGSGSEGTASGNATDADADTSAETDSRSGETELAVKAIPSLDPERSGGDSDASEARMAGIDARDRRGRTQSGARDDTGGAEREAAAMDADEATDEPTSPGSEAGATDELESLQSAIAEREERIDDLETELASATDEREELRTERDRLREERDDLEATVQELRGRVRELEAETAGGAAADELTRTEALEGTDLFVRYRSKSDPTLAAVADGAARDDVVANLRLERHTRFEAADAAVAGQPYDAFIETTLASRFVRWVVEDLPYEIRDTGHTASLRDLYDVLPDIDRAELHGSVSVETEDGTDERSFDIVLRDRMGDPLAVADLDTSRQPTGGGPMRSLIEDATVVAEGTESLAAAFFVTSSFFESDALEAARNETGTGLLSRDKRASVVKLSRKRGYHLCLVEARDESFHLTVPEL